jgi:outer membrane autotransporter protein
MILTLFVSMPAIAFEGDTTYSGTTYYGLSATDGSGTLTTNPGSWVTNINNGYAVNLQNYNYTVVNKGKVGGYALLKKGECRNEWYVSEVVNGWNIWKIRTVCDPDIAGESSYGINSSGNAQVINSGKITGTSRGISIAGDGSVDNSGTISGGVSIGTVTGGPATVVNSGVISADGASFAIETGNGDDTITLRTGSQISGHINTNGGNDQILLEGSGNYSGIFINAESLTHSGEHWVLLGSSVIGSTVVDQGLLEIGQLTGTATINSQGILGSPSNYYGARVTGNVNNYGGLSPGNLESLYTIDGNYLQENSGRFLVKFSESGNAQLNVTGTATLNGGTVKFIPESLLPTSRTFTFLQSGGLTGNFATVESPMFFNTTVNVVGNNMETTLTRNATYESLTSTDTQQKIASTLDASLTTATGDLAELMIALDQSDTTQEFQNGLDQMNPEPVTALAPATFTNSQMYNNIILQRLGSQRQGIPTATSPDEGLPMLAMIVSNPQQLAQALSGSTMNLETGDSEEKRNWRFFARTFGNFSTLDSEGTQTGFTANTFGLSLGVDKQTNERWLFGGSFGWSSTGQEYDLSNWDATIGTLRLAGHGSYSGDRWYADGILSYALNMYDSERTIQVGGFNRTAEGSHVGNEFSLYLGGGYHLLNGDWQAGPIGSVQYITLTEEGFEETGAGGAGLKFDSTNTNSLRSTLGFAVNRIITLENGTIFIPQVRAQWAHEWMDSEFTTNAQLLGAAGSSFEIQGKDLGTDSVFASAGLAAHWSERLMTSINYNIDVGRTGFTSHMFDLRLAYRY